MPLMRCTEDAFLVIIKKKVKKNLNFLTCGKYFNSIKLNETFDDKQIYKRFESAVSDNVDININSSFNNEHGLQLRKTSTVSSQNNEVEIKENEEMAPLFFFLASSFNVELVYIILKGITQFSYITCHDGKDELSNKKASKLKLVDEIDGSKTLTMS